MDKISELPEPILHHILTFLRFSDAARTCLLSKTWERVWQTYPVFKIRNRNFFPCYHYEETVARSRRLKVLDKVEKCLQNCQRKDLLSIEKFTIVMELLKDEGFELFVDRCVGYAIACNVKRLKIDFGTEEDDDDDDDEDDDDEEVEEDEEENDDNDDESDRRWYNLLPVVLCTQSIEVLKLGRCKLPRGSDIKLSSLRKLHLYDVYSNNEVIKNLFAGCPLIEELNVGDCRGFDSMELFGLHKINDMVLFDNKILKRIDMKLLNVRSLTVEGQGLLIPYEINVTYCTNLKNIKLSGAAITDACLYKLISEVPFLESLYLGCCESLKTIKLSSSSLKKLEISKCAHVAELNIDAPNLSHFTYDGGMMSLCSNALALSDIKLYLINLGLGWNVHIIELLAQCHGFSEMLKLRIYKNEDFNVPKRWRQLHPSPLSGGRHFQLLINNFSQPFSIAKVLDNLLWIAPHTKTLSVEFYSSFGSLNKTFFEIEYKKPIFYEGKFACCCKDLPISCWQSCIENVKFEITYFHKVIIQKRYYLEGATFLEKIDGFCEFKI